jgi:hypothetical protein
MQYTITFFTPENGEAKIIVTLEDGTIKEYIQFDKNLYLSDYPNREADIISMGW